MTCDRTAEGYDLLIESAKKLINARLFSEARAKVRQAIAARPETAAEAYNLLGVLDELEGERVKAQANYRVALDLQPDYKPAAANLHRSTRPAADRGGFSFE